MTILKRIISALPGGSKLAQKHSYWRRSRALQKIGDAKARFTHIYRHNKWKNAESRSGAGSTIVATKEIRSSLPTLISELGVGTILDAPCGDYHWMRQLSWHDDLTYIGGDIVAELISSNRQSFESESVHFVELDVIQGSLPRADLLLCRDCLIHFCIDDVWRTLRNFADSDIQYLLTSSFTDEPETIDIPTGHCRPINLQASPFHLDTPLAVLADPGEGRPDKILGLWSQQQVRQRLEPS